MAIAVHAVGQGACAGRIQQQLAQPLCIDGFGLLKDALRLSRRVEHPFGQRQHHGAGALSLCVAALQGLAGQIADLDAVLEHPHQHPAADGRGARRIVAVLDLHTAVVAHPALGCGEIAQAHQWQRLQVQTFLLEHHLYLAALVAMDA